MKEKQYIQKIINEVLNGDKPLNEGVVLLPDNLIDKISLVYEVIQKKLDVLWKNVPKGTTNPIIFPLFEDIFRLKTLDGKEVIISLAFVNDSRGRFADTIAAYRASQKAIIYNLQKIVSYGSFESHLEHELVHAVDPKLYDILVRVSTDKRYAKCWKAYKKNGDFNQLENCFHEKISADNKLQATEPTLGDKIYHKRTVELDPHMAPMIRTMKITLDVFGETLKKNSPQGATPQKALFDFLLDIEKHPGDPNAIAKLYNQGKYGRYIYLFFIRSYDGEIDYDHVLNEFNYHITLLTNWATRPTLYRKFLKYVYTELNK